MHAITDEMEIPAEAKTASKLRKDLKVATDYLSTEMKRMKNFNKEEECLLLPAMAASMLGISSQAIEKRIKSGTLKDFVVFGRVYVSGKQVDELMRKRIKHLLDSGMDKNKIEAKMYEKMIVNAKIARRRAKKTV